MAVSRARRTESRIPGHFSHAQTPTLGAHHPSEGPKPTARSGFCPPGARLAVFWGMLAGLDQGHRAEVRSTSAGLSKLLGQFGGACAPSSGSKPHPQGPGRGPQPKGSQNGKELLPRYPGWFSATFMATTFFPVRLPPSRNSGTRALVEILGPG